ncbi:nickel-binding protein [Fodinibius sediminis]|uniref:HTH araC/xylS-type domain-containing protein n=1 Tax=Fodinibius sediminis TaxID=1214077 RepID=A0A521EM71_9BACT|nr:nickel-binding protein [Fodinibius sediminis]SMO85019.1 Protein of unknown function [Fodinibius sediminis]
MPIYMDRHVMPGVTAMDVAEGHKKDLEVQEQFDCKALTYWFDEERGVAFCLIKAPDRQSVEALHNHSHGMIPVNIIEVDSRLVESFLGHIDDPDSSDLSAESASLYSEPALRTIMVLELHEAVILKTKLGISGCYELFKKCNRFIDHLTRQYHGKLITSNKNHWITSFSSTSSAVQAALKMNGVTPDFASDNPDIGNLFWDIGLSAGDPVTQKDHIYEEAIQLAERLCRTASNGKIVSSSLVQNLYEREKLEKLSPVHPDLRTLDPDEEQFLTTLMDVMDKVWNKEDLTSAQLSRKLGTSKSQLYRKITSLTGKTPTEFIKEIRLKQAVHCIENKEGNIAQVAFETGFNNPSYFSKCFRNRFKVLPSTYRDIVN